MTYLEEWQAISARIRGLVEAGELYARFYAAQSSDTNAWRYLRDQCLSVVLSLETFGTRFRAHLPKLAPQAIGRLVKIKTALSDNTTQMDSQKQHMHEALVRLRAFEAELSFVFSDTQQRMRSVTERGFQHLRRSIAVDEDVRGKWRKAFNDGERKCEALGAAHLLAHGIYAFKIDANRARTDLVFPDAGIGDADRYADALVLTEWKLAREPNVANVLFEQARKQAALYADGPLATVELRAYRYLVMITSEPLQPTPPNIEEGGVIYRHINIPVAPLVPSVQARR